MIPVFLIGGGWRPEIIFQTYGRFLQTATRDGQRQIAFIVAEEPGADSNAKLWRFRHVFQTAGLKSHEAAEIIVSKENPLKLEKLAKTKPTGIFVCGGLTPAYYEALCLDKSWLDVLKENNIPYGGFSAGAAIAAERAIIGGWWQKIGGQIIEITNPLAGEDLKFLEVRDGLGLAPFAVDVHATQWGTLSRLIHAVDADLAESGWAIDENTMLEIINGQTTVHGTGNAYFVRKINGEITVGVFNH